MEGLFKGRHCRWHTLVDLQIGFVTIAIGVGLGLCGEAQAAEIIGANGAQISQSSRDDGSGFAFTSNMTDVAIKSGIAARIIDAVRRHPVFVPPQAPVRVLSFARCEYYLLGEVDTKGGSNDHGLAVSIECPKSRIVGESPYGPALRIGYAKVGEFGVGLVSKSGEIMFDKSFGDLPENPPPLTVAQKKAVRDTFLHRRVGRGSKAPAKG